MRKILISTLLLFTATITGIAQEKIAPPPAAGFEQRIRNYIDSLRIIDTHEHLYDPAQVKSAGSVDFILLFLQSSYNDLVSAGMPDSLFNTLYNAPLTPVQKWKIIEPFWQNTFNTSFNRVLLLAIKNLYGISGLNATTVTPLSEKMKKAYDTDWFDRILRDSCRIDYIIQDGNEIAGKSDYFRYAKRFCSWLTVRSKYRIDSLAILQVEPIFTLEDFVKSLRSEFEKAIRKGMTVVKINTAYTRTLYFERVETEVARKVFRSLVNGSEDHIISMKEAKPLQDYMVYQLLNLASEYKMPVAFHTGYQAGQGNNIDNSNPTLLTNLFNAYPQVKFVLYHGSYPFGGELTTLAKNYNNVYIDMNWVYSISPTYSELYLNQWLETVPVSRLTAFGGDFMLVENVYSELITAKWIISNVLCNKVREGFYSESEAKTIAKMILFDNAERLYNLQ